MSPTRIILDFDGTITTKDTISILASSALSFHSQNGYDLSSTWKEVVDAYTNDYNTFTGSYNPVKEERKTFKEEIEFLRAGKEVEERSFARVSESGLFKGIREEDWDAFGREAVRKGDVAIRNGFREFVERIEKKDGRWGVVSVTFSRGFVRGVLDVGEEIEVLANQPDEEEGILSGPEGEKGRVLTSSDDKLGAMKMIMRRWGTDGTSGKVVYIGDSSTDIECLAKDGIIGVIMSEDGRSSLIQTMKRIGVKVVHIEEFGDRLRGPYWARDFEEILQSPLFS